MHSPRKISSHSRRIRLPSEPAAGLGTRMGKSPSDKASAEKAGTSRKQFMLLDGSPILIHTVRKFAASIRVSEIVVAVLFESGLHGNLAAPVARDVVKAFFDKKARLTKTQDPGLALLRRPGQ